MKFGLLGHKISYSLSPVIHKMINTHDIDYKLIDLAPEDLEDKLPGLTKDLSGFNVTIPHKQHIMEFCDDIDPIAEKIGAVNTVKITQGIWTGYNTDYLGFMETLKYDIPDFLSFHPVIVGYGGVARAVVFALSKLGFKACTIIGGEDDGERMDFINEIRSFLDINILDTVPGMARIWVNCTPVGGVKIPNIPERYIPYEQGDILYDLNYSPFPTHLENDAQRRGIKTMNGMKMLVSQAIEAQKIWHTNIGALNCEVDTIIHSIVNGKDVS